MSIQTAMKAAWLTIRREHMKLLRLVLLLAGLLLPLAYSGFALESIREQYSIDNSECAPKSSASTETDPPVVTATVQKQSEVLLNWGLGLASGVVAFIVTPSLHQFRHIYFIYLLLAPALSFLAGSIAAALLLLRRMTFLHLNGCLLPTESINALLAEQTFFLSCAAMLLLLFACWCLAELALQWPRSPSSAT